MSSKQSRKKNKVNIKLVTISVIVIIFIICICYNIISLFVNPTDTFMIENGEISKTEEASKRIIKNAAIESDVSESFSSPIISAAKKTASIIEARITDAESPVKTANAKQEMIRTIFLYFLFKKPLKIKSIV